MLPSYQPPSLQVVRGLVHVDGYLPAQSCGTTSTCHQRGRQTQTFSRSHGACALKTKKKRLTRKYKTSENKVDAFNAEIYIGLPYYYLKYSRHIQ